MRFLQKIKDSPHYSRLKNSAQYRYDRRQLIIMSVCLGIVLLPMMVLLCLEFKIGNPDPSIVLAVFYVLFLVGALIYFAYHWLEIFLHIDSYIFCQVRLDQPHVQGRGGAYFTVKFTDRHGNQLQRDTSKMFSSNWEPYLEEYNNQMVLIGYNEKTDRLVVIQRVNT